MFQILKNTNVDFMAKRNLWLGVSLVLVVASLAILVVHGIPGGIEFTGGSELQVKYVSTPDLAGIRSALKDERFGQPLVTNIGKPEENEIHIRVALQSEEEGDDPIPLVLEALRSEETKAMTASGLTDLNLVDERSLKSLLESIPDLPGAEADAIAAAVAAERKESAIFTSVQDLSGVPGMTPDVIAFLGERAFVGPLAVRSQSYIGPTIGKELVQKATIAIIGSLVGMLVYIWIRFQFQWGLAAVIASAHDTIITLGLFALVGHEMSLPVVAAFLTLIGYSVNDTVVVFDRIRENLALRSADSLESVVNVSINRTLSRTVITSGLTWIACLALLIFGGDALQAFAFVLVAGVVIGTYSSIYVASPILVAWKKYLESKRSPSGKSGRLKPSKTA